MDTATKVRSKRGGGGGGQSAYFCNFRMVGSFASNFYNT